MISPEDTPEDANLRLAHRIARLLRHEVGDLLQGVYSSATILSDRFVASSPEAQLLANLKGRAELIRFELDAVVDLTNPPAQLASRIDLAFVVGSALTKVRQRYPALPVHFESDSGLFVSADDQALPGVLTFLMLAVGQDARNHFAVEVRCESSQGRCSLERDGVALHPESPVWLREPFATTHQAPLGLALALTRQTVEPHGGSITVRNREREGIHLQIALPIADV